MFDLNPSPTFTATVQITQPGGGHRPLPLVFRHKKRTELNAFLADKGQSDADMVSEIVASVPELAQDKTQAQFFAELFENFPASPMDIFLAYHRELAEARTKN